MTDDKSMSRHTVGNISPELLGIFAEPGFQPVTVTIADLATVSMDARYQVLEVTLHQRNTEIAQGGGGAEEISQVEAALKEAFNEAMRQVMERNAARLSELLAQGSSDKPSPPAS